MVDWSIVILETRNVSQVFAVERAYHGTTIVSGVVWRGLQCTGIDVHVDKRIKDSSCTYQPGKPKAWAARWGLIRPFSSARAGVVAKSPFTQQRLEVGSNKY